MALILEFRLQNKASTSAADTFILKTFAQAAPLPGELVNLKGDPFIVASRGWAIDEDQYCYCRVVPASPATPPENDDGASAV